MSKTIEPEEDDRYLVPGLLRGLQILTAFTPQRREMSLSDLARAIGRSRSATFRAVYTLRRMGYLLHDDRRKTYSLGPAVMRLGFGCMNNRELVEVALPELERLRDETDWSTHLGVRDGARVLYLLRAPSRLGMGGIVHVGSRLPAATTTMGRILLAALEDETLEILFRDAAPTASRGNLLRTADIIARCRRDRNREIIARVGGFEAGVAAAAAPIVDMSGNVIAAINATLATDDLTEVPDNVLKAVAKTARRISFLLGGDPPEMNTGPPSLAT